ncbi:MAG: efflux RND transporter permease subunit [Bacteroidales bacterium]|nr:efflux RND transporter permease subunit [Bacteroidales bacterium]
MTFQKPTYKPGLSAFSVILFFAALTLLGLLFLPRLNVRLSPSRTLPSIGVHYYWNDASARVIEQSVTTPLEAVLNSISGVKDISSESGKSYGYIGLEFDKETNMDMARFEVSSAIRRIYNKLPEGVSYPGISVRTGTGNDNKTLISYTLSGSASPLLIQQYAEDNILPAFSGIKGVAAVNVYGASLWEWRIELNTPLAGQLGLSHNNITGAVNNWFNESLLGMAALSNNTANTKEFGVVLKGGSDTPEWHKIPVAVVGNRTIMLTDIATVKYVEKKPGAYYRINGLNTINIVLAGEKGTNEIKAGKRIKEKSEQIISALPAGYSLAISYDATESIGSEVNKTAMRSLYSLLFLLVFVLLVSRQLKYVLLIASSLFSNLLIAVVFYYFMDLEIHLYSLAGITVSFGIIIDNSIVMIDHYRLFRNRKVFLAVLAATLTTIGALSVIFFLEEAQRINLIDFSLVMIVNLVISLLTALLFIPSMVDKLRLSGRNSRVFIRRRRTIVKLSRLYLKNILFYKRFRWAVIVILVLGFGIPLHLLPEKIEKEGFLPGIYNNTLGSDWYKTNMKSWTEKILGGSLRLFSENVFEGMSYRSPEGKKLHIAGSMPDGCSVQQLNEAIIMMESQIARHSEVKVFETQINSPQSSHITITFKPEFEHGQFPYALEQEIISKAISIGGLDWSIWGVSERGFNNSLGMGYKSEQINLEGYNYDQLYRYAEILRDSLAKNQRVKDLEITGRVSWYNELKDELFLGFDRDKLAYYSLNLFDFFGQIQEQAFEKQLSPVYNGHMLVPVTLVSNIAEDFNSWQLNNLPVKTAMGLGKVKETGQLKKKPIGNNIYKHNQQYSLVVAYNFIGSGRLAGKIREEKTKALSEVLPIGYKVFNRNYYGWWDHRDKKQYYLLFLVIAIIYFICSVLLESLVQPLAVIALIPVSFIGVFLTFYLFGINFDQGGFASFILLAGIVVNSALYIVNDFNNFRKEKPGTNLLTIYIKSFNHKIIPVLLTIASTILGLVPFLIGGKEEVFWFSFATGSIGGLILSLPALLIVFPVFMNLKVIKKQEKRLPAQHN